MIDFIQGEKFIQLTDYIYFTKYKGTEFNPYQNTLDINKLKDGDIIYTHTHYVSNLFNELNNTEIKVILITHNSDHNIITEPHKNIIKWYSQNVNIQNDKIESIPIGLENNRWFEEVDKKNKMMGKLNEDKNHKNLLYINHNIDTNRKERLKPYEIFKSLSWVNLEYGANGTNFENYLDNIYNHKFVLCPEGNGIDTHRTWECLYLNTIPIEKININNQFYTDLPICFVNKWEDITEEFLEKESIRINNTIWNMDKLLFNYWRKKLKFNE